MSEKHGPNHLQLPPEMEKVLKDVKVGDVLAASITSIPTLLGELIGVLQNIETDLLAMAIIQKKRAIKDGIIEGTELSDITEDEEIDE